MTTAQTYTSADGRLLTTCGGHRTLGYALMGGQYACRECGGPEAQHESTDDTIARRKASAASGLRVCPTCQETDDMAEFWTPRCEADWWDARTPAQTTVSVVTSRDSCPFNMVYEPCPNSVRVVAATGNVRGRSCTAHARRMVEEHLRVVGGEQS